MVISDVMWRTLYTVYRGTYNLSVGFEICWKCPKAKELVGSTLVAVDPMDGVLEKVDDIVESLSMDTMTCGFLSSDYSCDRHEVSVTFQVSTRFPNNAMTLDEFKHSYQQIAEDIKEQLELEGSGDTVTFKYTEDMFAEYLGDLCADVLCEYYNRSNPVFMAFSWNAFENCYQLNTNEEDIRDYVTSFAKYDCALVSDFVSMIDAEPLSERIARFSRECVEYATMWYRALGVNTVQER